MPTLRIQFPEKDSPSTLVLDSAKITLGRRADNTVQIVDRTVSAFHAEFIREEDHYRLHDRESTNGTRVNGEPVTDYHLREACKISFGSVECEFSPEVAKDSSVESLPTRLEVDTVSRENQELKARIETLKQEVESLRESVSLKGGDEDTILLRDQLQRLVRERAELQDGTQYREREFAALKAELARTNRDRQNLQHALSLANEEITKLKAVGENEVPKQEKTEQKPELEASAPVTPKPAGLVGLPKPTSVAAAEAAPVVPVVPSKPSAPAAPVTPVATPVPVARPTPVARPAVAASSNSSGPRVIAQPAVKVTAAPRSHAGPSGTQKITLPTQGQGGSGGATPVARPLPRKLGQLPAVPVAQAGPSASMQE